MDDKLPIPASVLDEIAMEIAVEMEVHAALSTTTRAKADAIRIRLARIGMKAEGSGWKTIDSAPKDSHARLVWCPDRQNTYVVCWWVADDEVSGWMLFGGGGWLNERPTHWMALPAAPETGDPT